MARILFNALASTAGGGITWLENVLPRLAGQPHDLIFFVPHGSVERYRRFETPGLRFESGPEAAGAFSRMIWEQRRLRKYITGNGIDLLVALGNFALFASPVPQILFNRNDLYFSPEFTQDLIRRGLRRDLLRHRISARLARLSIRAADLNVTPTRAFAERIRAAFPAARRKRFETLRFGFDPGRFETAGRPSGDGPIRILYVSHYNYFRNFETLIRALPLIRDRVRAMTGRETRLVLTTDIRRGAVYGGYDAGPASDLIDRLGIRESIEMLGAVQYDRLAGVYGSCDLFVCPSYSESFGHPLIEAMAAGLPVVSADMPVHREVCGDAALYFPVFDAERLANRCVDVLTDHALADGMRSRGIERIREFSWDEHVRGLFSLIEGLLAMDRRV